MGPGIHDIVWNESLGLLVIFRTDGTEDNIKNVPCDIGRFVARAWQWNTLIDMFDGIQKRVEDLENQLKMYGESAPEKSPEM